MSGSSSVAAMLMKKAMTMAMMPVMRPRAKMMMCGIVKHSTVCSGIQYGGCAWMILQLEPVMRKAKDDTSAAQEGYWDRMVTWAGIAGSWQAWSANADRQARAAARLTEHVKKDGH